MDNKYNVLCVAYATDDNYAKFCGISLISLFEKNKTFDEISVYILDSGIGKDSKYKLDSISKKFGRNIYFIDVENLLDNLNLNMGNRKIAVTAYARLFLSLLIPENVNKLLYLDCDTIINRDLIELWDTNVADYFVAGVKDTVDKFFRKKIHLSQNEFYINTGVLLINLDMWRRRNVHEEFFKIIDQFSGNVPHHDQGVINMACKEKIILEPGYNMTSNMYSFSSEAIRNMYFMDDYYSQNDLDKAKSSPAIIHFTTGIYGRPWEESCMHPMNGSYIEVLQISPWNDIKLLPDSRGRGVKLFAFLYNSFPKFLVEYMYKSISCLLHFRE